MKCLFVGDSAAFQKGDAVMETQYPEVGVHSWGVPEGGTSVSERSGARR